MVTVPLVGRRRVVSILMVCGFAGAVGSEEGEDFSLEDVEGGCRQRRECRRKF